MREHPLEAYKRWWVGKRCRLRGSHGPFRLVDNVKFYGPPSGVYGNASLVYSDGTEQDIRTPIRTPHQPPIFRPRKKDVEVWQERWD